MILKKIITILLSSVLSLTLLVGCININTGEEEGTNEQTTEVKDNNSKTDEKSTQKQTINKFILKTDNNKSSNSEENNKTTINNNTTINDNTKITDNSKINISDDTNIIDNSETNIDTDEEWRCLTCGLTTCPQSGECLNAVECLYCGEMGIIEQDICEWENSFGEIIYSHVGECTDYLMQEDEANKVKTYTCSVCGMSVESCDAQWSGICEDCQCAEEEPAIEAQSLEEGEVEP